MKSLKSQDRQAKIVQALRQHGDLSVAELAAINKVSDETIRRDAHQLEHSGQVVKLHGALTLPHNMVEASYERRMREGAPAKIAIAKSAVQMVRDGESLIIDTGATTTFFARELRQRRNLTVVTNSSEVARTLSDVAGNKVFLAGGAFESDSGGSYGPTAVEFISRFRVKHAFISVTALNLEAGPMNSSLEEAEFAAKALSCATHRVLLANSVKFGTSSFAKICEYSALEVIVTETTPPPEYFVALREHGTRLLVATI